MNAKTFLNGIAARAAELSARPVPTERGWKFRTWRSAQTEIHRLESLLGLPQGANCYNLTAANFRIRELEAMASATPAAPTPPAAPQKAVPAPPVPPAPKSITKTQHHAGGSSTAATSSQNQLQRLVAQRARIAGDLGNLSGLDKACGVAKLAKLDLEISQLTKK